MHGIVLFAHGARDPEWARPFEAIRDLVRARRPEFPVELAFLDFMAPGGHIRNDLPRIVGELRKAHPGVPIAIQTAVGEVPEMLEAIAGWVLAGVD